MAKQTRRADGTYSAQPNGPLSAVLNFYYDLYIVDDNSLLDKARTHHGGKDPYNILIFSNHPQHYSEVETIAVGNHWAAIISRSPRVQTYREQALLTSFGPSISMGTCRHCFLRNAEHKVITHRQDIASLMEYRGALCQLCREEEFQNRLPSLSAKHADHIIQARDFLVNKHELIKSLRNDIGGHFQFDYAQHATANFSPEEIGKSNGLRTPRQRGHCILTLPPTSWWPDWRKRSSPKWMQ